MAEEVFRVRHTTIPAVGEADAVLAIVNRLGSQIVTDFFTQLILSGYAYHMQAGTEDAGINSTDAMDDELVWMVADNAVGEAMMPLGYDCTPGLHGAAAISMAMLEVDKGKVRYVSGGTTYAPANLRSDDPNSPNGTFKIVQGAGIVTAAKSAVPDTVELARKSFTENTLADTLGYPGAWETQVYSIRRDAPCVIIDAGSIVGHFGASGADLVGYGTLQFAQFDKALVV